MIGTGRRRALAGLLLLGMLAGSGCAPGDRALLGASRCPAGTATPAPVAHPAGAVYALRPHFGTGDPAPGAPAVAVPGWTDVVSVASTGYTSYAVRADGTVSAYGQGQHGSLGDGSLARHDAATPQPVPGITDARSVHVAGDATFVVRRDGTVLAWGDGLLAHAGTTDTVGQHVAVPTPIRGLSDVVTMTEDGLAALALRADGTVAGWGINLTDVLGEQDGTALTTVAGATGVTALANANGTVLAATATGALCGWGSNAHGLLEIVPTGGQSGRPLLLPAPTGVVAVAGGSDVGYALDATGAVWAWGRGVHGMLGDGEVGEHVVAVPRRVPGLPPVRTIAASGFTGYAIDTGGGLWAWGSGLALGGFAPAASVPTPVRLPLPGPAGAVSGSHVLIAGPTAPAGVAWAR